MHYTATTLIGRIATHGRNCSTHYGDVYLERPSVGKTMGTGREAENMASGLSADNTEMDQNNKPDDELTKRFLFTPSPCKTDMPGKPGEGGGSVTFTPHPPCPGARDDSK